MGSRTIYDYFRKVLQEKYDLQVSDGQMNYNFIDNELKEIIVTPLLLSSLENNENFNLDYCMEPYLLMSIFIKFLSCWR